MPTVDNITVARTGVVWVAPTAAAAPTDALSTLDAAFEELGYVTSEGLTLSARISTQEKSSWNTVYPAGFYSAEKHLSINCSLVQANKDVIEFVRDSARTANGVDSKINPVTASADLKRSFVFEWVDGGHSYRVYVPAGVIVDVGESQMSRTGAVEFPFQFGCVTDNDTDAYLIFWNDGQFAKDYAVTAVIRKTLTVNHAVTAVVLKSATKTHTVTAVIVPGLKTFQVDAVIEGMTLYQPIRGKTQNTQQPVRGTQIY